MEKQYLLEKADGSVALMVIKESEPLDWHIEQFSLAVGVPVVSYKEVTEDTVIPSDRTYRNAWTTSTEGIQVDMNQAKEIQKDRWRAARKLAMADLDIAFMKALEQNDEAKLAEIAQKKQELRDITKTDLSKIKTPEALKEAIPEPLQEYMPDGP